MAFSAYGNVSSLQGRPISDGSVMAKHGDSIEQAAIQTDGTFRLMGLKPGTTYTVTVESTLVERTLPGFQELTIAVPSSAAPNSDVTGLRFTSIEK